MAEYVGLVAILKHFADLLDPPATIKEYGGSVLPDWHFWCRGELKEISKYPKLYNNLGGAQSPWNLGNEPAGYFRLPDLRECTPVGVGKNTNRVFEAPEGNPYTGTGGTQNHDEYTLGQFKDDQFQGHEHTYILERNKKASDSGVGTNDYYERYYDLDSNKAHNTLDITSKPYYGNVRFGTTTHGKRVGVNYIIKY